MPIKSKIFNTDQIRAIQEGRMTQFMQVVKPQPERPSAVYNEDEGLAYVNKHGQVRYAWRTERHYPRIYEDGTSYCNHCPFGEVGDVVYCRENVWEHGRYSFVTYPSGDGEDVWLSGRKYSYLADGNPNIKGRTLSAAIMPREAARLFLRITNIRVMRVQELTGRDILHQGYDNGKSNPTMGIRWENMQRMHMQQVIPDTWNTNPYMWIIDFEKTDRP